MNSLLKQAQLGTVDHETVVHPVASARARAKVCCPQREIVDGSGPHLTKDTQVLLRLRLRAAAFILLVGFGVFLVRHVVGVFTGEPLDPLLLGFHVLVVLVLGFSSMPLCRQCAVSLRKLRVAELVIFGLPAMFFLTLQHRLTLEDAGRGFMPPPIPFWLLLIFTYGMFIPNTWHRAAAVIGAMTFAPVVLVVVMLLAYPEVAGVMTVVGVMHEHRMLKRPCAVKLIHPEQAGDPRVLARFEREVRMTARLSHWNTVEIYDYGRTEDGTFFYVMEYLPGLSLEDLLQRHGPLPAERIVHLLRQTCHGLREAHAIGLIHRDIKPANVFVAQRGGLYDVAKLLDFGLVKPVAEMPSARLTLEGAISGTPLFMSPEQARGLNDLDGRSDIYSLGAVAYALLTGRPPFERASAWDVMIAHARDDVVPPSKLQADVPADLERVILRCLAKSPEDRFQDVDSLEEALAECAAADQWTQSQAARWWQENSQTVVPREMTVAATV